MRQARAGHDTRGQRVTPRYRWAAGPGRTTSRRAERSSRRGRLTGGSPPTGTHSDQAPQVWRAPEDPWAWLRCPWAGAGPGRTTSRRAERSSRRGRLTGGSPPTGTHSDQAPQVWRAPEGPEGTAGLRVDTLSHTQQHGTAGVEGAGGSGGHGRASRSTTPSRRLACGDLAGGRARRRPEHPWGHKQHKQEGHRPRAHQAARPNNTPRGARNASGATRNTAQGRGPTGPRP